MAFDWKFKFDDDFLISKEREPIVINEMLNHQFSNMNVFESQDDKQEIEGLVAEFQEYSRVIKNNKLNNSKEEISNVLKSNRVSFSNSKNSILSKKINMKGRILISSFNSSISTRNGSDACIDKNKDERNKSMLEKDNKCFRSKTII